jgi:hypothetical protein
MAFLEAQQKASQILDAERAEPTVHYMSPAPFANRAAMTSSPLGQRGWHPRPVSEKPGYYYLESRNYALLKSLLDELDPNQRTLFFGRLRQRLSEPNPFRVVGPDLLGSGRTDRTNSELPLIAEFLVRFGDSAGLLSSLANAPLRPGLTRLLVHLEEMIALDYTLFSDDEYDQLESFALRTKSRLQELSRQPRISDTLESNYRFHVCQEGPILCDSIADQCRKAKYLRLAMATTLKDSGRLEGIESLQPNCDDENFDVLAKQVRSAIQSGTPEIGLDRLHTFALKFIRTLHERHFGRPPNRTATANALLGEFANDLRQKQLLQSKMASEILKSSARVLDEFNYVRNNQTLAHDNPELINTEEAYFIYQSVAASIRFLRALEEAIRAASPET